MKHIKKLLAFAIVAVMMLSLCGLGAYAQSVPVGSGSGSITITNAAISETYAIYKLFDATVSASQTEGVSDSIAYTGTIPESLGTYFTKDAAGNITATDAAKANDGTLSEAAVAAIAAWANDQTAIAEEECESTPMSFTGLDYGYYVVTSTQGSSAISVDSTNPNAQIIDKNTTPPIVNETKTANDTNVFVGQTVSYTVSFDTANYYVNPNANNRSEKIVNYLIEDNFANGALTDITVTSISVTKGDESYTLTVQQFDDNGKITIPWVDGSGNSLYPNGATLTIQYSGTVAKSVAIDGQGNVNQAKLSFVTEYGTNPPSQITVEETIYSYALAIKKVNQKGEPLAGATFKLPFYVIASPEADGAYVYAGTEASAEVGYTTDSLTTGDDGLIIIKGLEGKDSDTSTAGTYEFEETAAPSGYNKLAGKISVTATKTGQTSTSTTTYLDADGNIVDQQTTGGSTVIVSIESLAATPVVVVNKSGTEMPATGGIGTTIFYVVGSILVVGAAIVLVTKKRVSQKF